mmetsp:Transcript_23200/g.57588  ORF Transcript_23200/g.57588 Transcript_23200/m.57588 type:complete len:217 (+) Transcript_23200:744-1394(+)
MAARRPASVRLAGVEHGVLLDHDVPGALLAGDLRLRLAAVWVCHDGHRHVWNHCPQHVLQPNPRISRPHEDRRAGWNHGHDHVCRVLLPRWRNARHVLFLRARRPGDGGQYLLRIVRHSFLLAAWQQKEHGTDHEHQLDDELRWARDRSHCVRSALRGEHSLPLPAGFRIHRHCFGHVLHRAPLLRRTPRKRTCGIGCCCPKTLAVDRVGSGGCFR